MNAGRGFFVHLLLFALSGASAAFVWLREEEPKALVQTEATVWQGTPAEVQKVVFENKLKKVVLEAKQDEFGTYYVGSFEKAAGSAVLKPGDPPPSNGESKTEFVAVGAAEKLAKFLAPLKAIRAIGRIQDDRVEEFGLKEPEGTLTVTLRGAERKLIIGGATPGGGDRYVRDPATGDGYVLEGDSLRDLETADTRLIERDQHGWKEAEVTKATVLAGGKTRQITRGGPEGKRFWADPATADQKDETVGNWMAKLEGLRPSTYVMSPPEGKQDVVRVEYNAGGRKLGWVELVRVPGADPSAKPDYLMRTERTRLFAKVPVATAEQIEQDLSSILK